MKKINKIRLGLPKGSLEEATFDLLKKAGYVISKGSRSYTPHVNDPEIECLLIRAQEMAGYVADGVLDVGMTGLDWVVEQNANIIKVADLKYARSGFNPVKWVVAVPNDSKIKRITDLKGKRIATELVNYTTSFLKRRGIKAHVEFSWGATEVKPPLLADAIVELTETGASLKANNLRIIETVLESQTVLVANPKSWKNPWKKNKIGNLVTLLTGAINAEEKVGLKMNVPKKRLAGIIRKLPAMKNPTISTLSNPGWVSVETIIDEKIVRIIIPELKRLGASGIIEYPLNKVVP